MKPTDHLKQINPGYYVYTVNKPLFGHTCNIRTKTINALIREKATLEVRLRVGKDLWIKEVLNPRKWKNESKPGKINSIFVGGQPMPAYQREVQSDMEPAPFEELFSRKAEPTLREEELYI